MFMRKKGGDSTHIQIWIMCKMIAKENNRERERERRGRGNKTIQTHDPFKQHLF